MRAYPCAICKRPVSYQGRLPELYPFCSDRCRMVDLGVWFRERYAIDRDLAPGDDEQTPPPPEPPGGPHRT